MGWGWGPLTQFLFWSWEAIRLAIHIFLATGSESASCALADVPQQKYASRTRSSEKRSGGFFTRRLPPTFYGTLIFLEEKKKVPSLLKTQTIPPPQPPPAAASPLSFPPSPLAGVKKLFPPSPNFLSLSLTRKPLLSRNSLSLSLLIKTFSSGRVSCNRHSVLTLALPSTFLYYFSPSLSTVAFTKQRNLPGGEKGGERDKTFTLFPWSCGHTN